MSSEHHPAPPDALLLIAPGCPHCPSVLEGLAQLLKEGVIGALEAVNLAAHPERAQALGVKTVPWLRLGVFELEGVQSPAELRRWAEGAANANPDILAGYFHDLLISGRRGKVEELLKQDPAHFRALPRLLADPASSMAVRLGLGAVLEEFQPSGLARVIVDDLGELTRHADALTRADACHFLSLIGGEGAIPYLRACLDDSDAGVREIAGETLAEMEAI
ncbi:MAG: HEAT repeat domain-containing protein [Sulfuricellaceae bacterium]